MTGAFLSGTALPSHAGQPPAITRHPVPQVAIAGSSVTFIGATSNILATSLHWEKDGQPLPGAIATTLVLRHLQAADAGDYQFIASNNRTVPGTPPLGESATRSVHLTVITPALAAGQLDQTFGDSITGGMDARTVLALPDGGCLVAGEAPGGGRHLVRLSATGTLDPAFSATGANARIRCLAAHGTGFLVGGDFATYAGRATPRLARLTAQGALDLSFLPPALSTNVRALAVQRLAGGDRVLVGLSGAPWLLRLRPDGSADPTFQIPPLNGRVLCITLQADGRILLGGLFSASANWPYNVIARLRSDGTPDTSGPQAFAPVTAGPGGAEVLAIAAQANGRILLGGNFTTIAGENRFYLARLLANGTLDPLFQPEANDPVSSLEVQADGRILAGGSFSRLAGANFRSLGRLTPGGQADPAWTGCGLEDKVNALAVSGPFIFAAGPFTQPHRAAVKLLSNPPAQAPIATTLALPGIQGIPGQPLLLTVPVSSSADTTFTWTHPNLAPLLTTAPELFFPNAPPELAGTWSVTAVNDTGSLTWQPLQVRLNPASPGLRPVQFLTTNPLPVALPTLGTAFLQFPAPAFTVSDLRVHLDLQHTDVNDLVIELIAPDGQRLSLTGANSSRRGSNFEHTTFADDAPFSIGKGAAPFRGTWQPDQAGGFSSLRRSHGAGIWQLSIEDTDADASSATVQWACLEFFLPATLPDANTSLPPDPAAFQLTDSAALLRHWNAPPGLTVITETSPDLLQWQPATVLAIRLEADQSQRRTLALPFLRACYFRSRQAP